MEISMKLDRVTVSGNIVRQGTPLSELRDALKDTRWEQVSDYEFQLRRRNENDVLENVAGLFANQHQPLSWRLDTSNHLQGDEFEQIMKPIAIMSEPHLTRVDVAFDIINGDKPNMAHRIYRFNASERIFGEGVSEYTGRAKQIQTIYSGTRKSETQIRYYDKLTEQKSRRKSVDAEIHQWERLEIQLRGSSISAWKTACRKMLACFKMPAYTTVADNHVRAMLFALDNHVVEWKDLNERTARRYRNLIRSDEGLDDTYSQKLLKYFDENVDALTSEIRSFKAEILPKRPRADDSADESPAEKRHTDLMRILRSAGDGRTKK